MVLCLVTLTELYTRRALLSASAELLVQIQNKILFWKYYCAVVIMYPKLFTSRRYV